MTPKHTQRHESGRLLSMLYESFLIIIGVVGLLLTLLQVFGIKLFQGVSDFENVILGLVSSLILIAAIERRQILRPVEKAIRLEPETPLGSKLEMIRKSVSLESNTALSSKLDSIERTVSFTNNMRQVGLAAFYRNRRDQPKFENLISKANSNLLIISITGVHIVSQYGGLLEEKLEKGCIIRFLLPNLIGASIDHLAPRKTTMSTISDWKSALNELRELKIDAVKKELLGRVEIRIFNYVPTFTVVMVNGERADGIIRVELMPYKINADDRASFDLTRADHMGDVYSTFEKHTELLWQESSEFDESFYDKIHF